MQVRATRVRSCGRTRLRGVVVGSGRRQRARVGTQIGRRGGCPRDEIARQIESCTRRGAGLRDALSCRARAAVVGVVIPRQVHRRRSTRRQARRHVGDGCRATAERVRQDIVADIASQKDVFKVVEDTGGPTIDVVALYANGEDVSDRQTILDVDRTLVQLYAEYTPSKSIFTKLFSFFRRNK